MAKYAFPAVFTEEEVGGYSVYFPDIENCFTCGDDLADAIYMAQDILALVLCDYEREKKTIPRPSDSKNITIPPNSIVNYVMCDTLQYNKKFNSRAVKKTLSIPAWLNQMATDADINFSQVLLEALKEKLNIE